MNQWQLALCPVSAEVKDGLPSCRVLTICLTIEAVTKIYGCGNQNKSHVTNRYIADPGASLLPSSTLEYPERTLGTKAKKKKTIIWYFASISYTVFSFIYF